MGNLFTTGTILFLVDSIGFPVNLLGKLSLFLLNDETDWDLFGGVTDRLRLRDSADLSRLISLRMATSYYYFSLRSGFAFGNIAAETEWAFFIRPSANAP